jgi:drug/metabolite transporter (DMT)-like permease
MMATAASLAVLCLIASGLLDLVFKMYAAKPRSRGMLIFGIGCVWVALQLGYMSYTSNPIFFDAITLGYGIAAALFVTVSNILLVESMAHLPISMASTIYRLNTVPLVLISIFFLGEDINLLRALGIICGLVTVFLLYQPSHSRESHYPHYAAFVLLIVLASIIRALYGVVTKAAVNAGGDANTLMLLAAFGWCIGGLAYARFREHRVVLNKAKLKYIPIAGLLVFSIVWLLTTALTLGDASVVVPVANMGFIAAFLFSISLRMEVMNLKKLGAIGLAIISIALLTGSV